MNIMLQAILGTNQSLVRLCFLLIYRYIYIRRIRWRAVIYTDLSKGNTCKLIKMTELLAGEKRNVFTPSSQTFYSLSHIISVRICNKLIANNCALFLGVIHFYPCRNKACRFQYTRKLPRLWWLHFLSYQCEFSSTTYPALAGLGPRFHPHVLWPVTYYAGFMKLPGSVFGKSEGSAGSDGLGVCEVHGNGG